MNYPWALFRTYRFTFGLYLIVNYLYFLNERAIFHPELNFQFTLLPAFVPVAWIPSLSSPELAINALLSLGIISGLWLGYGFRHKVAALIAYACWSLTLAMHPLVYLPQDGYIGWFLLAFLLIPEKSHAWKLPEDIWTLAWIVTGLSYTVSGYSKLITPNWSSGEALSLILGGGPVRLGPLADLVYMLPPPWLKGLTWLAVTFELLAFPFCLWRGGRKIYWYGLLIFHLGILAVVDITSVTCAFLVFQLFLLKTEWLPQTLRRRLFSNAESAIMVA